MALTLKAILPPLHRPQLCQCSAAPPRAEKGREVNDQYPQVWPYWIHPSTLLPLTLSLYTTGLSYTVYVSKWWEHSQWVNEKFTHAQNACRVKSEHVHCYCDMMEKLSMEGKPFASFQCLLIMWLRWEHLQFTFSRVFLILTTLYYIGFFLKNKVHKQNKV